VTLPSILAGLLLLAGLTLLVFGQVRRSRSHIG